MLCVSVTRVELHFWEEAVQIGVKYCGSYVDTYIRVVCVGESRSGNRTPKMTHVTMGLDYVLRIYAHHQSRFSSCHNWEGMCKFVAFWRIFALNF